MSEARLWTGGRVFTGRRYVESLLVDGGTVVAVGTEEEVRRAAPTGVERVQLGGRLVLPGLIDAHLHLGELARFREGLNLSEIQGTDELAARLQDWAANHPEGPIVGRGLDVERSLGGRWPVREDLDRAVGDRPTVILHASGHAAIANSAALAASGIDSRPWEETRDRVARDRDGRPTGVVYEEAVRWLGPLTGGADGADGVARTLRYLASLGLTTVASMSLSPEELALLRSLATEDRLPIRVRGYVRLLRIREFSSADIAPAGRPGSFAIVGTKGFADGAFGPRTAWLSEPYADRPDESGIAVESDETLSEALAFANGLGLAPAMHAIGDQAVVRAVRLIAPYAKRDGARARVEHVGLTPPEALSALDEIRPALVVQPGFVWSDYWLSERLGPERVRWAYAFRTLVDRGHLLVGSSDAPYDPADPWRGLRAATVRRDERGRSANPYPGEALALEEAVAMYTHHGGRALGEPSLGSLAVGAPGDLVVLAVPRLSDAFRGGANAVRETWVGGERVFDAETGEQAVR